MPENRRKSTRYDVGLTAQLVYDEQTVEVRVNNLSLGGAQLAYDQRLPMGARANIHFRVPTHEPVIDVSATVRWSSAGVLGLQFDSLRPKEIWALNKYFEDLG